jgi:ParB-like nuclease domain
MPQYRAPMHLLGQFESLDFQPATMDEVHELFLVREQSDPEFRARMEELRQSMAAEGLREPVVGNITGCANGGRPNLGDGHHRFSAARSLGWTDIPDHDVLGPDATPATWAEPEMEL